jgi:hypothetical protein
VMASSRPASFARLVELSGPCKAHVQEVLVLLLQQQTMLMMMMMMRMMMRRRM